MGLGEDGVDVEVPAPLAIGLVVVPMVDNR
jgi:hypothetical protein